MIDLTVLSNKTLVMLVGPSAVGKSTLMNEVIKLLGSAQRVKSFTTRKPRSNDEPNQYFYVSHEDIEALERHGEIITQTTFPSTGETYGTIRDSYAGSVCLLDTLAHSVEQYRTLPFKQTITISVTTEPDHWRKWITTRYASDSGEKVKRAVEAVDSINWSLAQSDNHSWIINTPNNALSSAQGIIEILNRTSRTTRTAREYAEKIKSYASTMIEEAV